MIVVYPLGKPCLVFWQERIYLSDGGFQFGDARNEIIGDAGEHIAQISQRLDTVQPGGGDQRINQRWANAHLLKKCPVTRIQNCMKSCVIVIAVVFVSGMLSQLHAQTLVSFLTADSGLIYANLYGKGERGVVLAHGGHFNKESWARQAKQFAAAGFRVLAIDFRGYDQSRGPG